MTSRNNSIFSDWLKFIVSILRLTLHLVAVETSIQFDFFLLYIINELNGLAIIMESQIMKVQKSNCIFVF